MYNAHPLLFVAIVIIICLVLWYYNYHTLFCLYWVGSFGNLNEPTCSLRSRTGLSDASDKPDCSLQSRTGSFGKQKKSKNIVKSKAKCAIPKVIHQIWIGPKAPPMQWISTVENFARNNGYGYKLWRDQDIEALNLVNKDAYKAEPSWAGKADIARYEILYRYGGIYVDADSMVINEHRLDLDKVFSQIKTDSFAVYERTGSCLIANGIIGSVPEGEFMAKLIGYINRTYKYFSMFRIPAFISVGPYALSHIYYTNDNSKLMTILPSGYFYPAHWMGVSQKQSKKNIEAQYPNAYMYQFGYSTNAALSSVKKLIPFNFL